MATPRKVSVSLTVGLGARPVDITNDLVAFTFEEAAQLVGETIDVTVDNASGYYTGIWWVEKGTPIVATITTTDWNKPGDYCQRKSGTCWVDTVEWEVKPSEVTIKATSVSPNLLNDQANHQGFEGQSPEELYGLQALGLNSTAKPWLTGDGSTNTADMMRTDQDNSGTLSEIRARNLKMGYETVVKNGIIVPYNQQAAEAQKPYKTLTLGTSAIIKGKFTTNSVGKCAGSKNAYTNNNTGKTTIGIFTPEKPPTGTKSILNTRLRPLVPGKAGDNYVADANPVNPGQVGDPFEGQPYQS
jgi:uncharacterized protein